MPPSLKGLKISRNGTAAWIFNLQGPNGDLVIVMERYLI